MTAVSIFDSVLTSLHHISFYSILHNITFIYEGYTTCHYVQFVLAVKVPVQKTPFNNMWAGL